MSRPSSTRALEHALATDKKIFLAAQHDESKDDPQPADIFTMGCVANIVQSLKLPDGNIKVLQWHGRSGSYNAIEARDVFRDDVDCGKEPGGAYVDQD